MPALAVLLGGRGFINNIRRAYIVEVFSLIYSILLFIFKRKYYPWLLFILNPEQYGFCVVKVKAYKHFIFMVPCAPTLTSIGLPKREDI